LSPGEEWTLKKKLKSKQKLPKLASKIIKAGWKVRHELQKTKR